MLMTEDTAHRQDIRALRIGLPFDAKQDQD